MADVNFLLKFFIPFIPIREFMDSKTVLGYYFSAFILLHGAVTYLVLSAATMMYFISLSIYVGAFSEDFKTIISETNSKINFENKKSPKSRENRNAVSEKLTKAILLHYEMLQ